MRPEDTQACVARDIEAERKALPNEIYLIPESDGQYGEYWAWCDEPAPTDEHIPEEAVKYVRVE
jgi:hypothetical protein